MVVVLPLFGFLFEDVTFFEDFVIDSIVNTGYSTLFKRLMVAYVCIPPRCSYTRLGIFSF